MPPQAFQKTNERQGMRVAPASHDAHTRRPSRKRPKNTALGPWRSKNGSPVAQDLQALAVKAPRSLEQPAASLATDQVAEVVAQDRGGGRKGDDQLNFQLTLARQHAGRDERRLTRDGDPAGLGHHEQEQERIADMADVDDGGEHWGACQGVAAATALFRVFQNELLERRGRLLDVRVDDLTQHHLRWRGSGDEDHRDDRHGEHCERKQAAQQA